MTKKKKTELIRAKTTAKLQEKVQDMIKQGWIPEDEIYVDQNTRELLQTVTKDK